ncbi:MAG: DNA topoisomerase III [Opitutales bacterium]
MKRLVIAEKPSVATDLARVLGRVPKKGDFYENDEWVISSAVGHLVELNMPEDYGKKFGSWSLGNLPIVPEKFALKPIERTEKKFKELKKLLGRKDIESVINACDAGREGELIFTYIYELADCKKPVQRLWMSSMTTDAIRKAFDDLRANEQMVTLQQAARCRSEADWLIGINGTRGATIRMGGRRSGAATSVGRVQPPTLSLICEREREIRDFEPRTYWRILADFQVQAGNYEGVFQRADFDKTKSDDPHDRADRIWEKAQAEAILQAVQATGSADVSDEKKRSKQSSGRLYDLTSLQREANGRFGFSAGRTLSIAQSLYESHKMVTYPRTDSRALPEDYPHTVRETLGNLGGDYAQHARKVVDNDWVNPSNKRVFNNAQVSDHFAIIPTNASPKKLKEDEAKIYDMIVRRFISIFFPPAEFDVTTRTSAVGEHRFKTEGKVLVVPGYLEVYGKLLGDEGQIPPLSPADGDPAKASLNQAQLDEDQTRPPPRYSEATLLAAMEGAGKFVDDDELAEAMKGKGLGTPATRAQTIEGLVNAKYIERQGRELVPQTKADNLMAFLEAFGIDGLTSPSLTGDWEYKLRQIETGELTRDEFMDGIVGMTKDIVKRITDAEPPEEECELISFTNDKPLIESFRGFRSQDFIEVNGKPVYNLMVYKAIGNRKLERAEVEELLREKKIGPLDGFRSKMNKPYSAVLKLEQQDNGTWRVAFDFGGAGGENGAVPEDLSEFPVVGHWHGKPVHEMPTAYVTPGHPGRNGSGNGDSKEHLRVNRILLGKTIEREQFAKLLENGKTDLIKGFRSNRTRRLFDAFLLLEENGNLKFDFPPRAPKKKTARKTAAKKTAKKAAKSDGG